MTLALLSAAFLAGVFLADRLGVSWPATALLLLASVLAGSLIVRLRRSAVPALALAALFLGGLRALAAVEGDDPSLATYHDASARVRGTVVSDPEDAGAANRFRLLVDAVDTGAGWTEPPGGSEAVLVTAFETSALVERGSAPFIRYGDSLELSGRLTAPPDLDEFDYAEYLARQGISSVMPFPEVTLVAEGGGSLFYDRLYALRHLLARSLALVVPEPQAAVGQALLLGIRDGLPDDLVEDFRVSGTSHVLAVSGLHVGTLMALSLALSRALFGRRRRHLIVPLLLVWLYAMLTGASPSVMRAAVMATVYLAAVYLGRPRSVLPALGLAAAVMVAVQTETLWSVSFQLSFAALAGIATLAPPIAGRMRSLVTSPRVATYASPLIDMLAMSVAATAATLPLIAFHFERVSLVGLPATILMLPSLPLVLVTQAVAAGVGAFSSALGLTFGLLAWAPTAYVTGVASLMARIPGAAVVTGTVPAGMVVSYYVALALLYTAPRLIGRARRRPAEPEHSAVRFAPVGTTAKWTAIVALASAAVFLWTAALVRPDDRLRVAFVDIGEGDAAFISAPGGRQVVIDGGRDPTELLRFLGERMPLRDRTIELVVLSHGHSDHVTGLTEVLRRYDVERVLERRVWYDAAPYVAWQSAVAAEGALVVSASLGQVVRVADGLEMTVVNPPETLLRGTRSDIDNASVAVRLVYGDVSFLLTGDMFKEAERALLAGDAFLSSDVLKVGHHGSRTSSSAEFLEAVDPAIAVISAGEDNRFGHPHAETLDALGRRLPTDMVLVTRDRGTIEFVTDGTRLWVATER